MKQHLGLSQRRRTGEKRAVLFILPLILSIVGLSSCGTRPRLHVLQSTSETQGSEKVDINSATVEELESIPGIGKSVAEKIVAHRETYGRFQRIEHLLMVRGISERKFKQISGRLIAQ